MMYKQLIPDQARQRIYLLEVGVSFVRGLSYDFFDGRVVRAIFYYFYSKQIEFSNLPRVAISISSKCYRHFFYYRFVDQNQIVATWERCDPAITTSSWRREQKRARCASNFRGSYILILTLRIYFCSDGSPDLSWQSRRLFFNRY